MQRFGVGEENIIGLLRALRCAKHRLHFKGVSEDAQHGTDELLLRLCLVQPRRVRRDGRVKCLNRLITSRERCIGLRRHYLLQVITRKEGTVVVNRF